MRALFLIALFSFFLIGCSTQTVPISTTRAYQITIPESFYVCNLPEVPVGRLNVSQVGVLLIRYEEEIQACRNNMLAIKNIINDNNARASHQ